ncbi:MAG: MBL fold metallo-hydrolase [Pseudomonadales bacterium]|jgi:metallo-beta-lactamase class B|nr:MBL fold metallo-hydrolase [Pseudomonadales bacterium]
MKLSLISAGFLLLAAPLWAQVPPLPQELPRLMPDDLFRRNIGTTAQMDAQFPPHHIIGNVYYVGTETLASFLITTAAGHILVNTDYERNVGTIKDSVEKLGFDFGDIAFIIGSHEHADHMEGDALAKQLSGAQVIAVAEQVPGLRAITPGGKPHPIDRIVADGDVIELGGTKLTAHLTPGHTDGCTSWEFDVVEDGTLHKVLIIGSLGVNPNYQLWNNPQNPGIVEQYRQSYATLRAIPADVPLGSHPAMYRMNEKYPHLGTTPNPFIDPTGYLYEIALNEQAMTLRLQEQRQEQREEQREATAQ